MVDPFMFDDPCPEISKYLEATYHCTEGGLMWWHNYCARTTSYFFRSLFSVHVVIVVMCFSCSGRRECHFIVNNDFFIHDPCPGIKKYLDVTYACVVDDLNPLFDLIQCIKQTFLSVYLFTAHICTAQFKYAPLGNSSWRCTSEGFWSEFGPNTMECQSDWTIQRHDAFEETIKDQDASGIPELLRAMTSDTRRPMVAGDLPKLLDILDIVQDVVSREAWAKASQKLVNQLIVSVVHNTLRAKEVWHNWPLIKRQTFATRLLMCVERAMTSASVTILSSENYVQPLVMTEMSESIRTSAQQSNYFLFPSMALWAGENNVDSVDVPKEALEIFGIDRSRVYYASFANIGEEMEPAARKFPISEQLPNGVERSRRVISRVVGASIVLDGKSIKLPALPRPVIITFHHHPEALRRMSFPECSWWDFENFKWSSSGCFLQSHNVTHTICACNHMTHYAVLMDFVGHEISTTNSNLLTALTYGGCTLSIICLVATFLSFLIFVKGGGDRIFIHKNLCASLGIAELVFLVGIWRTEEKLECSIIAGFLLYFFLSALTWMSLEGYQLYQMLVEVFPSPRRRLTYFLIGYGLPAIITGAAAWYDRSGFGTHHHCWLRTDNLFILFFVVPAAFILLANTMFLFMTICIVYRHSKYIPCRHTSNQGMAIRTWVKGSMGLICLLGVTWTCGLLWIDDGHSIVMAYAFTIANSFQGLFIFLFHVVFSEKMRNDISRWCSTHPVFLCFSDDCRDVSKGRNNAHRETVSPSDRSGTGTESIYPTSEKMLTSPRGLKSSPHSSCFQQPLIHHYQRHPQINGTYDYATIAYGEMVPGHVMSQKAKYHHTNGAIYCPPYDQSLIRDYGENVDPIHQQEVFRNHHHRPPPDFSPPPPPANFCQQGTRHFTTTRPPSSKLSDDSAYSDGGSSSVLTTEITPSGATVLRMDLGRNQATNWRNV
ncbi:Latrophilin/CL-1-like GPS domain protein [Dictyocaulus viviparus]|uniref:Latrophilin/CL-1-like GPS domain protein n=1 Tax=Dictyocaulus viviparus TaxID=29172 RepID=A0A0D8XTG0_DICVI|nr:Latrophilin/CL-1-like GPS domain protein [Dictyocaulus viviparus]